MAKLSTFADADLQLHNRVREAFQTSLSTKVRTGHTGGVKRYSPAMDLFILSLLDTDGLAKSYGTSDTETQYDICETIAAKIKQKFDDERSIDSIYYRIRKLMKIASLSEIDYRHESKAKAKKAEKAAVSG